MIMGRNFKARRIFPSLKKYTSGKVLDVGGGDFFLSAKPKGIIFDHWTTVEKTRENLFELADYSGPDFNFVLADGCQLDKHFKEATFDTVLNIHVLEHVLEPIEMVLQCAYVLKPGGYAVFLIPQTASIHLAPNHYNNFTRFWIIETMRKAGLDIIELIPIGGLFNTISFKLFHFFFHAMRVPDRTYPEAKRNLFFYLMLPIFSIYALVNIVILQIFSLGDLTEDANNHLVVTKKTQ
jgi:SAM-dependent methyltransferase